MNLPFLKSSIFSFWLCFFEKNEIIESTFALSNISLPALTIENMLFIVHFRSSSPKDFDIHLSGVIKVNTPSVLKILKPSSKKAI